MFNDPMDPAEVEQRLWDDIERRQVGMLIRAGDAPQHAQPMTAFLEREPHRLWFFAGAHSELAADADGGQEALFIWQQPELQACIGGRLSIRRDAERMRRYWNAVVAAWRPKGRDDPDLTMLCMDCEDALVWVSTAGPIRRVWEIAKSNAMRRPPEIGVTAHLNFH